MSGWSRESSRSVAAERRPVSASLDPITPNPLVCTHPSPPSLCSLTPRHTTPPPPRAIEIAAYIRAPRGNPALLLHHRCHCRRLRSRPPPPPTATSMNMYGRSTAEGVVGSVLPSLYSLQENLQLPFFLSMPAPPVGDAAAVAMLCHGGLHHRVEEMDGNGWPSDLEWKADIHASVSGLKSVRCLSFLEKPRLGSRCRWPWMTLRPWIWSLLSTSSPPAPPVPPSTRLSLPSLTFPSSVAMDDPKTLDLELVVHLLSTRSPRPPSTPPPPPPPTFSSPVAKDDPKTIDLIKELVVHLFSTRSPSPFINPFAIISVDLFCALCYVHRLTEPWSLRGRVKDRRGSGSQPGFTRFRESRSNRAG